MGKMIRSSKPMRMWIDGNCYNIKPYVKPRKGNAKNCTGEQKSGSNCAAMTDHNFGINTTDSNKMTTTFRLPTIYYIRLCNFPDFNVKDLELETNTEVSVPKNGKDGCLIITGNNVPDIVNARAIIHSVVSEIREKHKPGQFISIPVNTAEVQENFNQFKDIILGDDQIQGMHETIFIPAAKLHLTVVVSSLMDDFEKTEAIAALNDCKTDVINPLIEKYGALKVKVAGISCMNGNLEKVNILYANAKIEHDSQEDILQKLANGISDYFYERGLIIQYKDNVKLHVTLINTKYRKSSNEASPCQNRSNWRYRRSTFDARTIMEKYKDYYFGEAVFDSVHLSHMSSVGEDGFYKPLTIVKV